MVANSQSHGSPIIVQYDQQLNILHANQTALDFNGKKLEGVIGLPCHEFWGHEPDEHCKSCPLHLIKENETFTSSLVRLHPGGNWWNVTVSFLYNGTGEKTGIMAVYNERNDLSQPRKPLDLLLENQYLAHPIPQIIAEQQSGNIILANIAMQDLLGLSFKELSRGNIFDPEIIEQSLAKLITDEIGTYGVTEGHIITLPGANGSQQYSIQGHRSMMGNINLISLRFYDVTEKQHLKTLLERLEQRFHSTLATTKVNVWEYNLEEDRFYIYVPNYRTAQEAVNNFNTTSLEQAGLKTVHPNDREQLYQKVTQFKNGVSEVEFTYRVFDERIDTYAYHNLRGRITEWSEDNIPLIAQGTITDVTELNFLKEIRNRETLLYEHLFKQSPVMVMITRDRGGAIVDANEAFLNFSGYSREECIGHHPIELGIWVDQNKWAWDNLANTFENQRVLQDIQAPICDKNGKIHQVVISISYVEWEGELCAISIGLDITEEYKLQQQLLATQQRMQNALDAINQGYFELNLSTNNIFANDNCFKMLGYQPEEIPFNFNNWLRTVYKDDRKRIVQSFRDVAAGKLDGASFRIQMIRKDGSFIWVFHQHKVIEFDQAGTPIRIEGTITDLTSQIAVEQKLQHQNETLEATFNAIDEGIWEVDFMNGKVTLNDRGLELITLPPNGYSAEGLNIVLKEIIHPEDIDQLHISYQQHLCGEKPLFHTEGRLRGLDGDWRWFNIRGAIIDRDKNDNPIRMIGALADITQRKNIEMMMRLAMAGVEQTSMMAFLFKPDASIDYVNQHACSQLGYTREELMKIKIFDLDFAFQTIPNKELVWQKNLDQASKVLSYDLDVRFIRKDKTTFPAKINYRVVTFEGEQYYWVFAIDISDIRAMENSLREERESLALRVEERTKQLAATNDFLDLILQALPIPIFIKNKNLEYVDVNEAFSNFYGIPRKELIGKTVHSLFSKDRADAITHKTLSILHTGNRITSQEIMINQRGENRETVVIRQSYTNPGTGKDGIVGAFLDINDRVKLQTQLEETNQELQRAMKVKDEFQANMSHELRTPLTSIIGYSELLLAGMGGKLQNNQEKYLNHIHSAGEHLLTLINDILDYSKFNAEVSTLNLEQARVRSICISAISIMEPRAFKKDVQMEFDFDESISELYCDPQRLRQILINLMNNAVKFSDNYGTIGLRVNQLIGPTSVIEFQVWDNGIGIDPEDQKRIFEPFTQIASELNRNYEGSGIGLALVKKFVDLHEGKIWVESEPGKGSVFNIHIPMKEAEKDLSV